MNANAKTPAHTQPAARPGAVWARAGLGLIAWGVVSLWFQPSLELALVWLGALVHAPLALQLARGKGHGPLLDWAIRLQLSAALLLIAAFLPEVRGHWLAWPWAATTGLCALAGGLRLLRQGWRRAGALADIGLVYFAIHGAWIVAAAGDWRVFGFQFQFAVFTAAHQLFAGLVLQVVASRIVARRPALVPALVAACGAAGNMMVAGGIMVTHEGGPVWVEFACAWFFAVAVIMLGWMQLYLAVWRGSGLPLVSRVLLVVSDLCLGTALTLAMIFAWGTLRGVPTLSIPEMLHYHAPLQVFGFALCGLCGWLVAGQGRVQGQVLGQGQK